MQSSHRGTQKVGRTGARFPRTAPPDEPASPVDGAVGPDAGAVADEAVVALAARRVAQGGVGVTGARFGRSGSAEPSAVPGESSTPAPPTIPEIALPAPRMPVERAPRPKAPSIAPDDEATAARGVPAVRPYVLTRGRTRSAVDLPVEALITADPAADRTDSAIVALCGVPRSVAEVAAHGGVPLGVARVLIGDLVASGALVVHGTAGPDGPSLALLHRVLAGLRSL